MNIFQKKFSIYEMTLFFIFSTTTFFTAYFIYAQNEHIKKLYKNIERLNSNYQELFEKNCETEKLKNTIDTLVNKSITPIIDSNIIIAQNDMNKFYIQIFGYIIISSLSIYLISNVIGIFSIKKMIPLPIFKFIQNYTPFYQEKEIYNFIDSINNIEYIIEIINKKNISLNVKNNIDSEIINLPLYIHNIKSIPLTNNDDIITSIEMIECLSTYI